MTILLIGCGRMGGAMARGWCGQEAVAAYDPAGQVPAGVRRVDTLDEFAGDEHLVVVLAVKPQAFMQVAPMLLPLGAGNPLILSIMAGIPIAALIAAFGGTGRVVRAMPNTPAALGKGMTGVTAGPDVGEADRNRVGDLLSLIGAHVWLDNEAQLDLVTAVSGSGPAYFFRMTEALAEAGRALGLAEDVALTLARTTLVGAAALAEADPTALAVLREQVTSPGGTTAAGLAQLDRAGGIDGLMADVVAAAAARARELSRMTAPETVGPASGRMAP